MKKNILLILSFILLFTITGCSKNANIEPIEQHEDDAPFNLTEAIEPQILHPTTYIDYEHSKLPESDYHFTKCKEFNNNIYVLHLLYFSSRQDAYLETFKNGDFSSTVSKVNLESSSITNGYINAFDIKDNVVYYSISEIENSKESKRFIVSQDLSGNYISETELSYDNSDFKGLTDLFVDSNGCFFEVGTDYINAFSKDGQKASSFEINNPSNSFTGITCDSNLEFVVSEGGKGSCAFYSYENSNFTASGSFDFNRPVRIVSKNNDTYYCVDDSDFFTWNTESHLSSIAVSLSDLCGAFLDSYYPNLSDETNLSIRCITDSEDYLVMLDKDIPKPQDVATLGVLQIDDSSLISFVNRTVAEYNRKNPLYQISVEMIAMDNIDRLASDISSGVGPDILLVDDSLLRLFEDKNALLNLDSLIEDELTNDIYSSALQLGTPNNTLVGLAPAIHVDSIITNSGFDHYNLDDLDSLLHSGGFDEILTYSYGAMEPSQTMFYLLEACLSDYYDESSCKSYFEEKNFARIVDLVKERDSFASQDTGYGKLLENEAFGIWMPFYEITDFSSTLSACGSDAHIIGFPNTNNNIGIASSNGYFAISASSSKADTAKAFFKFILSPRIQASLSHVGTSVRMSLADSNISYNETTGKYYWDDCSGKKKVELALKPDNTTFLSEWKYLLENSMPVSFDETIMDIVIEECSDCFDNTIASVDVSKRIDNRVSIYLMENK